MSASEPSDGFLLGGPVDKTSPVPLYFQIAENLRRAIQDGRLGPGDRLDNEIQICERLNVSRPTVRQAMQRLAQEGLVVRQRGHGTEVVNRRINRPLALSSLFDDLEQAGRIPRTDVLDVTETGADADVAQALGIGPSTPVTVVDRVRCADELPLAIMRNYLPYTRLQLGDLPSELRRKGLYDLLRQRGVKFHSAEETISARKATAREAKLLSVPRNSAVLTMSRVAYDPMGQAIEYGVHAYAAERYSFRVTLGVS